MASFRLSLVLLSTLAAIFISTSATPAPTSTSLPTSLTPTDVFDEEVQSVFGYDVTDYFEDVDDDDDEGDDDHFDELDGINLSVLSSDEYDDLLDDLDLQVISDLDILAGKLLVEARAKLFQGRRKRWIPLAFHAFRAARAIFSASRAGRVTSSGLRLTRQYQRPGNFRTAVKDFHRFGPQNMKKINGKFSGRTGTIGNHRITVRSGSKNNGPPTLEIRTPKGNGKEFVRKFRYD